MVPFPMAAAATQKRSVGECVGVHSHTPPILSIAELGLLRGPLMLRKANSFCVACITMIELCFFSSPGIPNWDSLLLTNFFLI